MLDSLEQATNVLDGRKSRIDNLLNTILLETQKLVSSYLNLNIIGVSDILILLSEERRGDDLTSSHFLGAFLSVINAEISIFLIPKAQSNRKNINISISSFNCYLIDILNTHYFLFKSMI